MGKTEAVNEVESKIEEILTRGVGTFADPGDIFRKKLIAKANGTSTEEIIIKFGVDPTRPDLHLGHAVILRKLRQMQDLGCKVIFLIGDYTAQIGDPTGKSKSRPEMEQAAIEENMKTYLDQVVKILSTDPAVFSWIRNSDWFTTITDLNLPDDYKAGMDVDAPGMEAPVHIDFAPNTFLAKTIAFEESRMQKKIGNGNVSVVTMRSLLWGLKHITHAQLVERDMFQNRIKDNESLFMHEMLYPVFQGIDSDVLAQIYGSCALEVGGTDQTFNMLMGRKIMEINKRVPQAVLAFELLVGLDGKEKMSKSLDNYVGITDEPNDMFGKVMSIPDSLLVSYFTLCTYAPMSQIALLSRDLASGAVHPKDAKMNLAGQIVELYHGSGAGNTAREHFVHTFQKKEIPEDVAVVKVKAGTLLVDALLEQKIVESKTDFRRLLTDGAIKKNGIDKLDDPLMVINEQIMLKIGKLRFVSFEIE